MAEPGVDIHINFSKSLQIVTSQLEAKPAQLKKAYRRAIKKTMRWLRTQIARNIASQTGIPQKKLKTRFSMKTLGSGAAAVDILWIGTVPVPAEDVGKARQTTKGVSVKKHRFEGAFLSDIYGSSGDAVWIRASRNAGRYASTGRARKPNPHQLPAALRGRFPLQHLAVEMADPAERAMKRLEQRVPDVFQKRFEEELNYVVNHE